MIGGESFIQTFADDGRLVQETFSSYYIPGYTIPTDNLGLPYPDPNVAPLVSSCKACGQAVITSLALAYSGLRCQSDDE